MYRIQAYNKMLDRIMVYIVDSMQERDDTLKRLRNNPDYGLVTFEYNARGAFSY
jgi:hypothetical protein